MNQSETVNNNTQTNNNQNNNLNINEPVILGELKKEKSSKPIVAFLVFALVIGICFGLPYIRDYFSSEDNKFTEFVNGFITKYITKDASVPELTDVDEQVNQDSNAEDDSLENDVDDGLILLQNSTILNIDNVFLENISIANNTITYKLSARSEINLDEFNYYLEIYSSNKELLSKIKLNGIARSTSQEKTEPFEFNEKIYYVKLVNNSSNENIEQSSLNTEDTNAMVSEDTSFGD